MKRRRSREWILVVCITLIVGGTGCSSSASSYFIHPVDGWKLKEAVDPKAGAPGQPSLDWYAEYERFPTPNRSELIVVSGHDAARLRTELISFKLRRAPVREMNGRVGTGPDGKPAIAIFEPSDDVAVMGLSYDVSESVLLRWMDELRPATEEQWIAAGGRITE